ncbi:unnamed protein product [Cyprideis torosa]|uniref:Uncharacterized protein n=1 Tax=Cyprideis torosa TaxID=163714 RepID=A0A7R8WBY0_9CRUS|nr:unnamed protein product [Cyprideis torosa]CAG0886931.1 unnamed protein product [Cyprideis torosa]
MGNIVTKDKFIGGGGPLVQVLDAAELENDKPQQVQVKGPDGATTSLLLVKHSTPSPAGGSPKKSSANGEVITALGSKCPHYGAPLVNGHFEGGRIRCPWHGACFSTQTGDIEDFPAIDSIPCVQLRQEKGKIVMPAEQLKLFQSRTRELLTKEVRKQRAHATEGHGNVVIIGSGGAGQACADELVRGGFRGRIRVVTSDAALPYDRPKLSKNPAAEFEQLALREEDYYKAAHVEVILGTSVTSVDSSAKTVCLKRNGSDETEEIMYQTLVIAPGASPVKLPLPGIESTDSVLTIRSLADAGRIAAHIKEGARLVVLGGSFVALELAAFARGKGAAVTVVMRGQVPFETSLGPEIGAKIKALHEVNGVVFETGTSFQVIYAHDDSREFKEVLLTNGKIVEGDVCVLGVGATPATEFLKETHSNWLDEKGFIPVDKNLRVNGTSKEDEVFACGDATTFPYRTGFVGGSRVNISHWQVAQNMGRAVGKAILAAEAKKEEDQTPFTVAPFFWTVHYGKSIRFSAMVHHQCLSLSGMPAGMGSES